MDVAYRALFNAGFWAVGRLSTDADRARVVEATAGGHSGSDPKAIADVLELLAPRWFVLRNAYQPKRLGLLESRHTYCWLREPMTRGDLRRAVGIVG